IDADPKLAQPLGMRDELADEEALVALIDERPVAPRPPRRHGRFRRVGHRRAHLAAPRRRSPIRSTLQHTQAISLPAQEGAVQSNSRPHRQRWWWRTSTRRRGAEARRRWWMISGFRAF